ncbi:transporter substrate-binding domain-containing protein [Chitinivorax sp. B]|uniref:substrate-binding periplasmic protein n=1 Tax=Chitinivorax sp. B TaxID=2502235 RepID=UPI0010F956AA|nr:transporter substrate-binding domain-containing protein [Chitinivorax sp. B]
MKRTTQLMAWVFTGCLLVSHAAHAVTPLQIYTEEWPPITFSKAGKPAGLAVEVVQAIQAKLKQTDLIRVVPWARGWAMATTYPNVVLFTVTRTPERESLFTFLGPVAVGTTDFYALRGTNIRIRSLEDARELRSIGVYHKAVEEQLLLSKGFTNLDTAATPDVAARKLIAERISVWCNANLTMRSIMESAGLDPDQIEKVYTLQENWLYLTFSRGTDPKLIDSWHRALQELKQDGTFDRIYRQWLPGNTPPEKFERFGAS